MSSEFGLAIGESFAELLGFPANQPAGASAKAFQSRWYLPKKNLADGLREALKAAAEAGLPLKGRLWVASQSVERTLNKGQGRGPAFLVTTGFESWLRLHQPFTSPQFALSPQRKPALVESDFIFGIGGRVRADGQIEAPLAMDELEFLCAKLEMLKVKDVALGFLHSKKHPQMEAQAASYLREKGFRVVASHEQRAARETDRWRLSLESAYAESAICEEKEQIESAVKSASEGALELAFWSAEKPLPWSEYTAIKVRFGLKTALAGLNKKGWVLHCGLDEFLLLGGEEPPNRLGIRATQLIRHGMWPFPHYADERAGFEPGPMSFGKSQQLAALDVFYVRDRLQEIDGLTSLLIDRSRARILESLFTLGKSHLPPNSNKRPPDALTIASDLERAFVERLNSCLAFSGVSGETRLTGPLAATLLPLLKERRPDLKFKCEAAGAWAEALACAPRADLEVG